MASGRVSTGSDVANRPEFDAADSATYTVRTMRIRLRRLICKQVKAAVVPAWRQIGRHRTVAHRYRSDRHREYAPFLLLGRLVSDAKPLGTACSQLLILREECPFA